MPALTMYDEAEFRNISPAIRFLKEVDSRTSYRTRQMLVAPIVNEETGELQSMVQLSSIPCPAYRFPGCGRRRSRAGKNSGDRFPAPTLAEIHNKNSIFFVPDQ